MSGFSQNITSPLPDANVLFDPVKAIQARQTIQQNQLGPAGRAFDAAEAGRRRSGQTGGLRGFCRHPMTK